MNQRHVLLSFPKSHVSRVNKPNSLRIFSHSKRLGDAHLIVKKKSADNCNAKTLASHSGVPH
jgi:hypothetical protein